MKNYIGRRIIWQMSMAIIFTSILISALGIYLSEGIISDIRGQENIPDLSVLSQVSLSYMEGNIDDITFGEIMRNSGDSETRKYYVYDEKQTLVFGTAKIDTAIRTVMDASFESVLSGNGMSERVYTNANEEPIELVGMPVVKDGKSLGAVYVVVDMVDLKVIRNWFLSSLVIAIVIVVIFVVLIANIALKRIVKPVRNVVGVALSMIEGDFSVRADETLVGEIGFVGKTLNKMSIELYKNVSQLFIEKNRLSHVLESLEEGMLAVDEKGVITHFNTVCLRMFGLDVDEVKELKLGDLPAFGEINGEVHQVLVDGLSTRKKVEKGDKVLMIVIEPIEDEHGAIVGSVVLFSNITEMEQLELTRRNYVANVSHELRSPLTSIQGLIEPLIDGIVEEEKDKQRYYNIIYQESLRLSRLVNDVMELSRLQTSAVNIEKEVVELNEVIDMVYERFKLSAKSINLLYKPLALPPVASNYDRIEQVLVILLDNATKFTPDGGMVMIEAGLKGDYVEVSVKDTGIGITEANVPHIFDRFFKTDLSRTQKGTGLGLSIAKEIMELMDEDIYCTSKVGEGSTFTFTLHLA